MLWKAIDTNSRYEVSDTGQVRVGEKILKTHADRRGYRLVCLTLNGKRTTCRIHRLVLHAFSPHENEDKLEVHHIDGDVTNNNLSNLMWVTHEENIRFIDPKKLNGSTQFIAQAVEQLDLEGNILNVFPSMYQAWKETGANHRHISEVCRGKRKTCGGFKWRYFEGSTTNCSSKCYEMGDSTEVDEDIV